MHRELPKEIDPLRMVHSGRSISGQLMINAMPRLSGMLLDSSGAVQVNLNFGLDEFNTPYMEVRLETKLVVKCERCLEAMVMPLRTQSFLAVVDNENKIALLPEQYEPLLIQQNESIQLTALIEDELILALPIIIKHEQNCVPDERWQSIDSNFEQQLEKAESPFAVLSTLKSKH